MSGKKSRFQPGGREYEKKKSQNKRRGPKRTGEAGSTGAKGNDDRWVRSKPEENEEEGSSGEEEEEESSSGEEEVEKRQDDKKESSAQKGENETASSSASKSSSKRGDDSDEEDDDEEDDDDDDDENGGEQKEKGGNWKPKKDKPKKAKGIEHLIETENPNRAKKEHIKVSEVANIKQELTRKER